MVTMDNSSLLSIAKDRKKDFEPKILQLYQTDFSEKEKELRKEVLLKIFNNENNAKRLLNCLW